MTCQDCTRNAGEFLLGRCRRCFNRVGRRAAIREFLRTTPPPKVEKPAPVPRVAKVRAAPRPPQPFPFKTPSPEVIRMYRQVLADRRRA